MLEKTSDKREEVAKQTVFLVARALQISPFGVNVLGGVPYINKIGLTQKAKKYSSTVRYEFDWVKVAMDDLEKAICKCRVMDGETALTDWVLGECSPSSMHMGTLKGYQNHMAQTRAKNRAIIEAFGVKMHEDMLIGIDKLIGSGHATEEQKALAGRAVSTSVEEVGAPNVPAAPVAPKAINLLKASTWMYGATKGNELAFIEEKLGRKIALAGLSDADVMKLKLELAAKCTKRV